MKYYFNFDQKYAEQADHWERSSWVERVRSWLLDNAGEEEKEWAWARGDLLAVGVSIKDKEVATLFKLRFGV